MTKAFEEYKHKAEEELTKAKNTDHYRNSRPIEMDMVDFAAA